jgi:membrane fusion protein, multidrug efflux system
VRIRAVFSPQTKVESQVSDIHAMIDSQTGLVQVLAPIPADSAPRFVIGSYLTAEIILDRHQGLSVPRSAVLRDKQGAYVFTVADGKARRVAVTTGIEQDDWIEITQGLKAGEPVVVSGNYELSDGMPVREGN